MTIGNRLKKIRVEAGMTQQDMANLLGIERTAFSKIETGRVDITLKHLLKIVRKFEISLDWLLLEKGEKSEFDTFGEYRGTVKEMLTDMENDPGFFHGMLSHYYEMKQKKFFANKNKAKE